MTTLSHSPKTVGTIEPAWVPYSARLRVSPYEVAVGETVVVTGEEFAPGAKVELVWHSADGRYESTDAGEFVGQRYERAVSIIATAVANKRGHIRSSFAIPLDFGGPHDIRARVEGEEVAQVGVLVKATWTLTPAEGPIGTLVELKVTGLDSNIKVNTWHLLWDNHYFGMMTGVTTRGVGVAKFRAAGPVGEHYIAAWRNSHSTSPYLAGDYSPLQQAGKTGLDFKFTVTEDCGALPPEVDLFPDDQPAARSAPHGSILEATPDRGLVGSLTRLRGSGFPAGTWLDLVWFSVVGASVMNIEPREIRRDMGKVRTAPDGTLSIDLEVPDDLGGSHRIGLFSGDELVSEGTFVILPSVVSYTPEVRAGGRVDVHLKGVGWTEYDKNYAVTYDNAFIGYVCALSTNGDIRFRFTATGAPGTHLLDLYPMIYKAQDPLPVVDGVPHLTYTDDHPGRKTPAVRLSIQVKA
ncbi:MAG TPA: hypothetical protein VLA89_00160 [Gemmatimonadales bacterium]|nr:hypothetical protein [Gemmatimonadales bacterium]